MRNDVYIHTGQGATEPQYLIRYLISLDLQPGALPHRAWGGGRHLRHLDAAAQADAHMIVLKLCCTGYGVGGGNNIAHTVVSVLCCICSISP